MSKYVVYMLRCSNHSLYTGITNNLKKRIKEHNLGKASKYTRSHLPVEPVYVEEAQDKSAALRRELAIKALPKEEKELLIKNFKGDIHEYIG